MQHEMPSRLNNDSTQINAISSVVVMTAHYTAHLQ